MPKHGKRYRSNLEKVDREHHYSPAEAVSILKDFEPAKYDETVEVHIRTGLNVRHADQQKLKVLVDIFERQVPVELSFDQVKKID